MFHLTFVQIGVFDWLSGRQRRVNFSKNVLKSSSQETIWRMKPKLGILAYSDFIWNFGKLHLPSHLGKDFIKSGKISAKIHEIGKIKAIFGLKMTPI